MIRSARQLRLAAPALVLAVASCGVSAPRIPVQYLMDGHLDRMHAFWTELYETGDVRSLALALNGMGEVELLRGDVEQARNHLLAAGRIMGNWQTSGSEVAAVILGSDSARTWKGDPHEKIMNAVYTGLLDWFDGQADNARACFKKAILCDADSDEGEAQVDCALSYWLAGRASIAMGLESDADDFFAEALQARRFAVDHGAAGSPRPRVLRTPRDGNLICVFSLGLGPEKVASGPHGSIAEFIRRDGGGAYEAEVLLDGDVVGTSELLADLNYQATTRGGREIEGIREGKAVFKDVAGVAGVVVLDHAIDRALNDRDNAGAAAIVGGGLLLLSWLTSASADTRHWGTLPASVHVLTVDAPPGEHELLIRYRDRYGRALPSLEQTWLVDVPAEGESIYHFRSLPTPSPQAERSA